ncbi:MAG: methylation-associated defense system AAA family ATPase MAD3 [bacterium]
MIRRLQVLHYRAFKYIDIELSSFLILVGPNASGKSTFLDVVNLIKDILNESPHIAVSKRASRFDELLWIQRGDKFEIAIELGIPPNIREKLKDKDFSSVRYEISLQLDDKKGVVIGGENLWLMKGSPANSSKSERQMTLFPAEPEEPPYVVSPRRWTPAGWRRVISKSARGNDYFKSETTDWNITYKFGPLKASLARIPEDEVRFPASIWTKNILMEGIQFLQLNSSAMRWPCRPDLPVDFQPDGSNLPKVIQYLKRDHTESFSRWVKHIQTVLSEIEGIEVRERPEDRFLYLNIRHKDGLELPSWVISDGTLRLFAQTIIAYLPEKHRIYMIEEPENGLHPLAIESIFQSLSSVYDNQIMLATHSPAILRLAEPKDILCFSKTASGAVDIVRGKDHPKLRDWRKGVDLATLHAAGVLQ